MIRTFIAILLTLCVAAPAAADGKAEVLVPVQQFTEGMNTADYKLAGAGFVEDASIVDDIAPYHWQGKGATAQWLSAIETMIKAAGTRNFVMKLGKPRHVQVKDDLAYVVVPSRFGYKLNGKPARGSNLMTLVLRRQAEGWRITAFTVSAH